MFLMKDIVRDGKPILRKQAHQVYFPLSKENKKLAKDLMQYLEISQNPKLNEKYKLRPGVGLAAPQIGQNKMMAAILVDSPDKNHQKPIFKEVIINPVIISHSIQNGALTQGEGCLSVNKAIPGFVHRHDRITLKYQSIDGKDHQIRLKDYPAIVCQHEIDHLHGILFYDHIDKQNPFAEKEDEIFLN